MASFFSFTNITFVCNDVAVVILLEPTPWFDFYMRRPKIIIIIATVVILGRQLQKPYLNPPQPADNHRSIMVVEVLYWFHFNAVIAIYRYISYHHQGKFIFVNLLYFCWLHFVCQSKLSFIYLRRNATTSFFNTSEAESLCKMTPPGINHHLSIAVCIRSSMLETKLGYGHTTINFAGE